MKEYSGWAKGIEESDIFMVLGTENYFKDITCFMQVKKAKELRKTFLVALEKGVAIPPGYFDGVEDIKIFKWKDREELSNITKKLIDCISREDKS